MKKVIPLLLVLAMAFSFVGCGQAKNPDLSEVMKQVQTDIKFPEMAEQTATDLAYFGYEGVAPDDVEEIQWIMASSGMTPEEVLIVKMKEEKSVSDMKAAMEKHKETVYQASRDYSPEQIGLIDDAVIETKGQYAFYAVTPDNDTAKKIFKESF